jgi:hypothetical protein
MSYTTVDVSESELEDLVRRFSDKLEFGMRYLTHQKRTTGGRLDVLLADSGSSLVVAELKVVEDDDMLMQALDYYDYLSLNLEAFARVLGAQSIDPNQKPRIVLIAPSFSRTLVARAKWLSIPITLYRYQVIKLSADVIPVFIREEVADQPEVLEISSIDEHLAYIKSPEALARAKRALDLLMSVDKARIVADPNRSAISLKYNGRVFAYLVAQRQQISIGTYSKDDVWTIYPIKTDTEFDAAVELAKEKIERIGK